MQVQAQGPTGSIIEIAATTRQSTDRQEIIRQDYAETHEGPQPQDQRTPTPRYTESQKPTQQIAEGSAVGSSTLINIQANSKQQEI